MESKLSPLLQSPAVQHQLVVEEEPSSAKTLKTEPPASSPVVGGPPIRHQRPGDDLTSLSTRSPLLHSPTTKLAPSLSLQPGYKPKLTPALTDIAISPPLTKAGVMSSPPQQTPPEPLLHGSGHSPHQSPSPPASESKSGSPDTIDEHRLEGSSVHASGVGDSETGPLRHRTLSPQPVSTPLAANYVTQSLSTAVTSGSVPLHQISKESLLLSTPEVTAPRSHFSPQLQTPKVATTLPSARKVAFEHTPDAVSHTYTTPTQFPSLFETAQPPTPFQHANFDLDSSSEDFLGSSSSQENEDFESGSDRESEDSSVAEAKDPTTPKRQIAEDRARLLPPLTPREDCGQSPLLPGEIATGNLLNYGDSTASPLVPALTESAGTFTEAAVHKDASGTDLMELSMNSQDALLRLLPSQGSEGKESGSVFSGFGPQATPQGLSGVIHVQCMFEVTSPSIEL